MSKLEHVGQASITPTYVFEEKSDHVENNLLVQVSLEEQLNSIFPSHNFASTVYINA